MQGHCSERIRPPRCLLNVERPRNSTLPVSARRVAALNPLHLVWERPGNKDHTMFERASHLEARALAQAASWPCDWLRGLLPKDRGPPRRVVSERRGEAHGELDVGRGFLPFAAADSWTVIFGDASGWAFGSHTELRAVGCGLAQVAQPTAPFL